MPHHSAKNAPGQSNGGLSSAQDNLAGLRGWYLMPVVLVALWIYAIYRLGTLWESYEDYRFGWFVPLLCLALFWERWKCRPTPDTPHPSAGIFLLFYGCGLTLFAGALFLDVLPDWRFAGWIFGPSVVSLTLISIYFWGGRKGVWHLAFPILFFLVAIPWPLRLEGPLIFELSHLNASLSAGLANLLGTPCMRQGTLIETGGGMVGVEDACSGIRSLQSTVMVALFLGEMFRYHWLRRLALLFGGMTLALACNSVRTTYLVCTCDQHGNAAVNLHHDEAGLTILVATLAGLLLLTWLLRPRRPASTEKNRSADHSVAPVEKHYPTSSPMPRSVMAALLGLVVCLALGELGMELWFRSTEKAALATTPWIFQLPTQNLAFQERAIPDRTREMLKYDEGQNAEWQDAAGHRWQIYGLRWLPTGSRYRATEATSQARGHAPDVCLRNAGMILQTNLGTKVLDHDGIQIQFTTERFLDHGQGFHVLASYWEPRATAYEARPQGVPSTSLGLQQALQGIKNHDRGRCEKRVIKIGVWGMETDEMAQAALEDCLLHTLAKPTPGKP